MTDLLQEDTLSAVSSDLGRRSGLSEWRRWFIVLLIASIAIIVPVIAGPSAAFIPIEFIFYGLIIGVAAITMMRSLSDAQYLQRETDLATSQVRAMVELDDISEFLDQSKKSQFRSHIEALYTIFQQDTEISQENLIVLLQERLEARNRLSELFSSILITLGLTGTIAGLIIMVSELRRSMQDFDGGSGARLCPALLGFSLVGHPTPRSADD